MEGNRDLSELDVRWRSTGRNRRVILDLGGLRDFCTVKGSFHQFEKVWVILEEEGLPKIKLLLMVSKKTEANL